MSVTYHWVVKVTDLLAEPNTSGHITFSAPQISAYDALSMLKMDAFQNTRVYEVALCKQTKNGLGLTVYEEYAVASQCFLPDMFEDHAGRHLDTVPARYKAELLAAYAELYPLAVKDKAPQSWIERLIGFFVN